MKNEQQVVNLLIAKRLKELGVPQKSTYYWLHIPAKKTRTLGSGIWYNRPESYRLLPYVKEKGTVNETFSAFNVAELGELLPVGATIPIKVSKAHFSAEKWWRKSVLQIQKMPQERSWHIEYVNPSTKVKSVGFSEIFEADARGKMLIYLLENGIITNPQ